MRVRELLDVPDLRPQAADRRRGHGPGHPARVHHRPARPQPLPDPRGPGADRPDLVPCARRRRPVRVGPGPGGSLRARRGRGPGHGAGRGDPGVRAARPPAARGAGRDLVRRRHRGGGTAAERRPGDRDDPGPRPAQAAALGGGRGRRAGRDVPADEPRARSRMLAADRARPGHRRDRPVAARAAGAPAGVRVPQGRPDARRHRGQRSGSGRGKVLAVRGGRRAEDHQLVPRLRGPRAGLATRAAGIRGRAGRRRGARTGQAGRRPHRGPQAGRGDRHHARVRGRRGRRAGRDRLADARGRAAARRPLPGRRSGRGGAAG